ncbi:YhcH/YjgK/YiaL family protein [Pseudobutyrivibrio ruminis]|uniref:YhcH/YjgK/YiaL family protein n=1 Tax=Pseudobutyrivibrio ruminis TaxID=46206 RepID=UPI0018C95B00|nr:YhcH/YjgK/YiaL family protein [Pseudobutyrivibrio ruminis]
MSSDRTEHEVMKYNTKKKGLLSILKTINDIDARIERVSKMLLAGEYEDVPSGILADGTPYRISEYETKDAKDCIIESHREHIDVQFVISGSEWITLYAGSGLTSAGEYNVESDAEFWQDGIIESRTIMRPGSIMVIKENVPHMGCVQVGGPEKVKKLVCKVEV